MLIQVLSMSWASEARIKKDIVHNYELTGQFVPHS